MRLLTETLDLAEIESLFRQYAPKVWKNSPLLQRINFTFLLVPNKEMKHKVLMSIAYSSKPWAMGDSLIQVPSSMTVKVNERMFELPPEQRLKIIIHEIVHIGYADHSENFIKLCVQHGGAPSEMASGEETATYKVQVKQGARFVTVKNFPITLAGKEEARKYGYDLVKQGQRARIVI